MTYWLMKSEPNEFSIDDLQRVQVEPWDGVRNYQARNMMRDEMQVGDLAFFYHSNSKPSGIVGVMSICKAGYPDTCAFDPNDKHYDPKSDPDNPRWYRVDVQFVEKFPHLISLETLKKYAELSEMPVVKRGNRLSIMPVNKTEWTFICELAK